MKVMEKLNALDEKVMPTPNDGWQAQRVRYWWLEVLSALTLLGIYLLLGDNSVSGPMLLVVAGLALFRSGFLYNERLRQLGRTSRWPSLDFLEK